MNKHDFEAFPAWVAVIALSLVFGAAIVMMAVMIAKGIV
jgi:hypothetical protein